MRFNCGKILEHTYDDQKWHKWFAFYPVKVKDNDCRWLEYVETRFTSNGFEYYWEYREIND